MLNLPVTLRIVRRRKCTLFQQPVLRSALHLSTHSIKHVKLLTLCSVLLIAAARDTALLNRNTARPL